MIKFSKNLLFNPAQIHISGIKCNSVNIAKIINVFECEWIVMAIDSLTKDSVFLSLIKNRGLKFSLKNSSSDYVEVSVVIPSSLFEEVLEKAISENPENIFLLNLLNSTEKDVYLKHSFEELVIVGTTNMFISIALDENALLISLNKSLTQPREIYRKMKALQLD